MPELPDPIPAATLVLTLTACTGSESEDPVVQQFINEGKIAGKIEAILTVIESRFGPVPEALSSKLEQITDLDRLSNLLRLCLSCETVEAIERELE